MSRPPIKAMESIKKYCEKTQCRRCYFGMHYAATSSMDYVGCKLQDKNPCDWDTEELGLIDLEDEDK